jgi:hypothetical protein
MHNGTRALTNMLPAARYHVLDGGTHMVKPKELAPVLADFFSESRTTVEDFAELSGRSLRR